MEKQRVNQIEEHKKILEKLKEIKSKKLEQIKIKEQNLSKKEKIGALFNKIKPKGISFLKGEISDLKEKVEFVNEIENYLREEINYNYISIANNLISPSGAIYYNNNNYIVKILGYIGSELSLYNINNVYIEKHPTNEFIRDITFKIITSGLATQTIYKLIIESPNKINEFRNNTEKWIKFNELIKEKIYDYYNISRDDICFFNYDIDNLELFLIIYNKHLNGIPILLKNFGVKTIIKPLLNYIILSPNFFEIEFCRKPSDWNENNLIRGGKKYYPPNEYFGLALKIKEKYNKYDNVWFGKIGEKEGEWPVAYHGVGRGNVFMKVFSILNEGLKVGPRQLYKNRISKANLDDFNLCEKGVYLAPDIKEAEKYADKINLGSFKNKFQFVIMTRVNPKKIRDPGGIPVNWILNGNEEEIRQYRLLIKISSN